MALDPTLSEVHFKRSMKKFLLDNLAAAPHNLNLLFKFVTETPTDGNGDQYDHWVVVSYEDRVLDTLSSAFLLFAIFTRKDEEGFQLARILDSITEVFKDENQTDGLKRIPLFDTTDDQNWVQVGGIVPLTRRQTGEMPGNDQTMIKTVSYELRWGAK